MNYLLIAQSVTAILLMVSILLQQRGSSLGSAFGGSGSFHATRRGAEEKIFRITIVLGAIFIILALLNLFLS